MKKIIVVLVLYAAYTSAYSQQSDSMRLIELDEIHVIATRAENKTPVTHSLITKKQIESFNSGQDIPFILSLLPSTVATSDAGAGIGYTGVRIRGVDPTRINVTANGIPLNDAESHALYWVNIPDFASSVNSIQVQRGIGSSANGAGAFGASINMQTEHANNEPYSDISLSAGSYNTHREIVKLGTGLMNNRFAFDVRLSNINSDGYIDRASSKLRSYFVQGAYFGNNTVIKLIVFGGKEQTYHAWDGIDAEQMKANRRYNPCGAIEDDEGNPTGLFYNNQTDNYLQNNYQLIFNRRIDDKWNFNVTLHYTSGNGYYEEYKNGVAFAEYGLHPFVANGETVQNSNIVRRKPMTNDFFGNIFSVNYKTKRLSVSLGGGINRYVGDHWGNVIWIKNYIGNLDANHEYYRNSTGKTDANIFGKVNYEITERLNLHADLQYRFIAHKINGNNDVWDNINETMQALHVDNNYKFVNPKVGVYYKINTKSSFYASFAVGNKEPTRNNFTDAKFNIVPKSERLYDYETGYSLTSDYIDFSATLYYMNYKNQLVLTGEKNDIGEVLTDNVAKSYRAGIELSAAVKFTKQLTWNVNAAFSRNKIKNYTEYLDNYDEEWNPLNTQTANTIDNATIAYSPSVVAGSLLAAKFGNFTASFHSAYVGKQYVTNSEQEDLALDAYFISNLRLNYVLQTKSAGTFDFGIAVNNIFGKKYSSNGWGSSAYIKDSNGDVLYRSNYMGYYPQAVCNFMFNVTVRF